MVYDNFFGFSLDADRIVRLSGNLFEYIENIGLPTKTNRTKCKYGAVICCRRIV